MLLDKKISSSIFEITIWSDLYVFLMIRFKCDHMRQLDINKWRISSMPAATVTPLQPSLFDMHHSFPAVWYVTMIKKTVEPIRSKVIHALTKAQFAKVDQNVNLFDKELQIAWFNSKPVRNYNIVNLTRIMIFFSTQWITREIINPQHRSRHVAVAFRPWSEWNGMPFWPPLQWLGQTRPMFSWYHGLKK